MNPNIVIQKFKNSEDILFNDITYDQAKRYVSNTITVNEHMLYMSGGIRKIYNNFDHLLLDNIRYYNRILRTIIFTHKNKLINNNVEIQIDNEIRNSVWIEKLTPTTLYYLCMLDIDSTTDEMLLAYPTLKRIFGDKKFTFEEAFSYLVTYSTFYMTMSVSCSNANTNKYSRAFAHDTTDINYINTVLGMKNNFVMIRNDDISHAIETQIKCTRSEDSFIRSLGIHDLIWIEQISEDTLLFKTFNTVYKCTLNKYNLLEKIPMHSSNEKYINYIEDIILNNKDKITRYLKVSRNVDTVGKSLFISMLQQYIAHSYKRFVAIKAYEHIMIEYRLSKSWNNYELISYIMMPNNEKISSSIIARGSIQQISYVLSWMNIFAVGYNDKDVEQVAISKNTKHAMHLHHRFKIGSDCYEDVLLNMDMNLYEHVKRMHNELVQ